MKWFYIVTNSYERVRVKGDEREKKKMGLVLNSGDAVNLLYATIWKRD